MFTHFWQKKQNTRIRSERVDGLYLDICSASSQNVLNIITILFKVGWLYSLHKKEGVRVANVHLETVI